MDDAAAGIAAAAEKYDGADPVNLGSSEEISIHDLAKLVAGETGYSGAVRWDASRPNGQPRRKLDVSKAERFFGWRSKTPLVEGIKRTVSWYRDASGARSASRGDSTKS